MRDQHGQVVSRGLIAGIVAVVITLLVGSIIITEFYETASSVAEEGRENIGDNSVNYNMEHATAEVPDNWDNIKTGLSSENYKQGERAGDNAISGNAENGGVAWSNRLYIPSLRDSGSSIQIVAKYRITDNFGVDNHEIYVNLERPGGDNVLIYYDNTTIAADNTTWYTVDNDISGTYINAVGAYKLWLVDNADCSTDTGGNSVNDNFRVEWDNAKLTMTVFERDYPEEAVGAVGDQIPTVYKMLAILIIVIIAAVMLKAVGAI